MWMQHSQWGRRTLSRQTEDTVPEVRGRRTKWEVV
jgi:hypothetical protein